MKIARLKLPRPVPIQTSHVTSALAASQTYKGSARYIAVGKEEKVQGPIAEGLKKIRETPAKYFAIKYQTVSSMFCLVLWDPLRVPQVWITLVHARVTDSPKGRVQLAP